MAPYGAEQQALIRGYFNPRDPSGKPLPFKLPKNAGAGIKLPKIGGLRLRRGVTTGKFGKRDIIVDANGKVYGLAKPGQFKIGIGNNPGFLSLVPKPKKPKNGKPGTPGAPGTGTGAPGTPPDEYASYDKDYPWIASYLRSLRNEETAFNDRYKNQIQPGVATGLESLGKIGEGIANTYGGQVGTSPQQPGYVSNIYGVAANLTPAQVASGMGGAASVYDPNSVAARQGLASAASASAQADARYRSLMAGLSPVSTAQGLLAGLASQAATISKSYADKRMSERVKLDQWIAEQKASAADRQIRQQYNMALLGIKQDQLALDQQQYNLDVTKAQNEGVKTDTQLAAEGFKRVPAKVGPKNAAKVASSTVTSKEGNAWFKPGGKPSGSGSGGAPTGNQRLQAQTALGAAYAGGQLDEKGQLLAGNIGTGYRDLPSLNAQAQSVAAFVRNAIQNGFLKNNAQDIGAFIYAGIPNPVVKDANNQYGAPINPKTGKPLYKDTRRAMVNLVLSFLGLR